MERKHGHEIMSESERHKLPLKRGNRCKCCLFVKHSAFTWLPGTADAFSSNNHTHTYLRTRAMRNSINITIGPPKSNTIKGPHKGPQVGGSARCSINIVVLLACAMMAMGHGHSGVDSYGRRPDEEVLHKIRLDPPGLTNPHLPSYASNTYQ